MAGARGGTTDLEPHTSPSEASALSQIPRASWGALKSDKAPVQITGSQLGCTLESSGIFKNVDV